MSLSFGSSTKKTSSKGKSDPWAPTIPSLTQLIGQIGQYQGNVGATTDQQAAFEQLKANAGEGNPYAGDIDALAQDLFATPSQSGTVSDAYGQLQEQLGGIAAGDNLDVNENPYIQEMLQFVGDDIQNRINAKFAGAGRDLSGMNQKAVARGVSEGTLPALFNQYNLERGNQADAAKTLFGAGAQTGTTVQGLDSAALLDRLRGIEAGGAAIDAENYGPNTILALEQQLKQLPVEDLGRIEALLGPLAQLGQQTQSKSTEKGSSMGLGVSNLFGGLGSLLSDERMKEDEEMIGELADGTPIYRFRYAEDPTGTVHMGVMAQEVEGDNPAAVTEFGGVKFVNYGEATDEAAELMKKRKRNGQMPNSRAGYGYG